MQPADKKVMGRRWLSIAGLVGLAAISGCSGGLFEAPNAELFSEEVAEERRLAGLALFEAIELPAGMEWITNNTTKPTSSSFSNQYNPLPGRINARVTVPEDRPPFDFVNELDLAVRETGVIVGYINEGRTLRPCDDAFTRSYRHTGTNDQFTISFNSNRPEPPYVDLTYFYTGAIAHGSAELGLKTTEWLPPACGPPEEN